MAQHQPSYFPPPPQSTGYPPPPPPPPAQASPGFPPPNFSYPPPHMQTTQTTAYPPPRPPSSVSAVSSTVNGSMYSVDTVVASPPTSPPPTGKLEHVPGGAPVFGQFQGATSTFQDNVGTFNGGSYRISHRGTNTVLTVQLARWCPLTVKTGAMLAMSPTITVQGAFKLSLKKFVSRQKMTISTFTGPGELLLAPSLLGDITVLRVSESEVWKVGQDALLAATSGLAKDLTSQNMAQMMFSGEGIYVYKIKGNGLLWLQSFGAIMKKDIEEGETYFIENGHLVAWNCEYKMRTVASGMFGGLTSGEGVACRFEGPGTVYFQTRNPLAFAMHLRV